MSIRVLKDDGNPVWWVAILELPLQGLFWLIFAAIPSSIEWLYDKIAGEK